MDQKSKMGKVANFKLMWLCHYCHIIKFLPLASLQMGIPHLIGWSQHFMVSFISSFPLRPQDEDLCLSLQHQRFFSKLIGCDEGQEPDKK